MICYCDGNPHEFVLVSDENDVKRYECPECKRIIEESSGGEPA